MLSYARANEAKIIASVVALIHRIAAHIHRPHPRPSRAIARARASHESTGTFHSNRSIPRAHHHTVRARARARRSPSTPARDRGDPKGFRAAPVVILPRRAPPVALLPRRATKTRASSKVPVVRRSHLHDGTLARRVKRRRRQPRARLVSGLARWSPAGCILSPSYFYTLTEHHHGYAHVSNTSLVYITTCPTKSRPHTPRTRTPRRRTRFAKFAKDGRTDAFDWIGFRMSLDRPLDVARRRR